MAHTRRPFLTPGQYGNTVRNYCDDVAKWINARF